MSLDTEETVTITKDQYEQLAKDSTWLSCLEAAGVGHLSHEDKWAILGRPRCPWCRKAEQILDDREIDFSYFDILQSHDLTSFLSDCGLTTVPQIYKNGNRIGGYEALRLHFEQQDSSN